MVFSADETCDVGNDSGHAGQRRLRPADNAFSGQVNWVQIGHRRGGSDDHIKTEDLALARSRQ